MVASAVAFGLTYSDHAPLIPLIAADFGLDDVRSGLLSTGVFLTNFVTTFFGLPVLARFGPKRTVTIGLLAATAGTAVMAVAPSYPFALVAKGIAGIGSALTFVAAARYLAALYGGRRNHFAFGLYGAGFPLGSGLALVVMPLFATTFGGWHRAYAAESVIIATVGIAWAALTPAVHDEAAGGDTRDALRSRNAWLLFLQHSAGFGLALSSGTWITVYLLREFSLPLTLSGALGSGLLILAVAGRTIGGWLVGHEHVPTKVMMRVAEISILVGVALLAVPARPLGVALLGAGLVGLGVGLPYAAVFNTAAASMPTAPSASQSLTAMGGTAGAMTGAPLMGYAVQTYGFAAAWAVVGAVALIAFGGTFFLRGEEELA